jgi:hypothetical protein
VRAAAPQRRHHSCPGCNGLPHSGQASPESAPHGSGRAPGAPAGE